MIYTPENITKRSDLPENAILVFGSNLAGKHIGGVAKLAREEFGARMNVGVGLQGDSYAYPTLDDDMEQLTTVELLIHTYYFYAAVSVLSEKVFYLTKVGCGIAGYEEEYMKKFFAWDMPNLVKPKDW